MIRSLFRRNAEARVQAPGIEEQVQERARLVGAKVGLIAGNGEFPLHFIRAAQRHQCSISVICHEEETLKSVADAADAQRWIKLGALGALISFFKEQEVQAVAMAGGIDRVRLFGNVKLDARGAALLLKVRSMKDDLLMRGIAAELEAEGIEVIPCTLFLAEQLVSRGVLGKCKASKEEAHDIEVGRRALLAMSAEHIGQTVVVRDGVVVAVEAVEGTDRCIARGGELGGPGSVVVKCAKLNQDMRFDVPTVGPQTIESLIAAKARVLALEAERTLLLEPERVFAAAEEAGIVLFGTPPLRELTSES